MTPTADPPPTAPTEVLVAGLRRFVARRVPVADVDDVVQEILVRLQTAEAAPRNPTAWVWGVARHTVADHHRARRRDPLANGLRLVEEAADEPAGIVAADDPASAGFGRYAGDHDVHEEVLTWLRPTAEELPETYRDALLLADFEGLPQKEVAERLGIGLSATKSRIQRGREALHQAIEDCCHIELGTDGRVTDFRRRDCDC